jgi:hypothetical protein
VPKIRALFEPIFRISSAVFMAALFKLTPRFPVYRCAQLTAFLTNFHSISVASLYDRKKGEDCFVTSLLVMHREGDNEDKPCPFYNSSFLLLHSMAFLWAMGGPLAHLNNQSLTDIKGFVPS